MSLFGGTFSPVATTIAILGTGSIGTRHYRCFSGLDGVEAVAVPARPERVAELQAEGIRTAPEVPDHAAGVVIATDTDRHLADWQKYSDRFCLIEKPLAGDPSPELETLVAQTEGRAFTACVLRFNLTLSKFKELIDSKEGKPHATVTCKSFLPDWRPNRDYRESYSAQRGQGGALRELIHEIDYTGWIFGWPSAVKGKILDQRSIDIADEEGALVFFDSPASQAQLCLEIASQESERRICVPYPDGDVFCDLLKSEVCNPLANPPFSHFPEDRDAMYIRQAEAFVHAIQGEDSTPLATAAEGLKALQVCEAVRLSSRTGKPVTL